MKFSTAAVALLSCTHGVSSFSVNPCRQSSAAKGVRPLFGILDEINSDSYNLMGSDNDGTNVNMNDAYEMFLADLVFSTNDPRVDIINKIDLAGSDEFVNFLDQKIDRSKDPEERLALKDLYEMIIDIKTKMEVSKLAEERAAKEAEEAEKNRIEAAEADADAGRKMSTSDVLKKAAAIEKGEMGVENEQKVIKKNNFYNSELTPEIRLSYEGLLKKVMPPYNGGESYASVVYNFYDQFDAQFVKVLNERASNGENDASELLAALADEQQKRMAKAAEILKSVLSLGEPARMEGALIKKVREGEVDEAFLLLLEANENQARIAGANGPAELMKRLRLRAADEKDKQLSSKEIRLIRKLLRTDDANAREQILEDAFTPKTGLLVPGTAENAQKAVDGEVPDQEKPVPEVPPPDFINACKAVLLNFGNLGSDDENRGDLASRIKKIASEAEVVATRIYGQGMSVREYQDRVWKDQTTSIFDLETMEIEAERNGEAAPWSNPDADDMFMPGFDSDGRMQIGGS